MLVISNQSPLPSGHHTLFVSPVQAGFPSPADDFVETALDLNTFLVHHPAATFFARVSGTTMLHEGIFQGDYLVVDRSLTPTPQSLVLAVTEDGEIGLKRFAQLAPTSPQIWGVVTSIIRKV